LNNINKIAYAIALEQAPDILLFSHDQLFYIV